MVLEEKFAYIASQLAGELNATEEEAFQEWLTSDPSHMQLLEEATVLWKSPLEIPDANSAASWEKVSTEIKPIVKMLPRMLRVAMILILIGLATGVYMFLDASPEEELMVFQSTDQQTLNVQLRDSSQVVLAPNSKLVVKYPWVNSRSMTFSGTAFFDVEKDKNRPFEITTDKGVFQVLGTSFFVQTDAGKQENLLAVEEGRVRFVNNNMEQVEVSKGFALHSENEMAANDIVRLNQTDAFWLHKKLFYSNVALSQVILDLEKLYRAKIVVSENAILNCTFSGRFNNNSLNEIIEIIAFALDLNIDQVNQYQYSLKGSGC